MGIVGGEIEHQQRWQGSSLSELIANRRSGTNYSEEINVTGFVTVYPGIQLYGEGSNIVGNQPDAVVGIAGGYKEALGVGIETSLAEPANNLSIELSFGIPDSGIAPGASLTLGFRWQGNHDIMVAVPSKISVQYPNKDLLANERFAQTVEYGKYKYTHPLPSSPIYAPESIRWKMWHQGYDAFSGMKYPFSEWEDGWPPWEQPLP